jgi:hypothetical protein
MPCKPIPSLLLLALIGCGRPAVADDACAGFKWDVTREHALFAGTGAALTAGKDARSAPALAAGRLYELRLWPQSTVAFAVEPGKKMPDDGQYAGLAALKLPVGGDYRVSLDAPAWLDVAANGKLAAVEDYQGQHDCDAPRKVVEFDLKGTGLVLQVSGASKATIRLTVTPAPPKT